MASTKTKSFNSAMTGAPVLNGTAGSLIALLDAVLVNGFGLVTVTGLSVSAGIATATVSAGHSLAIDSVGLVAGATPAGLNGEKRILSIASNSFTFAATGIADGAATGTMSVKVAPAGWTKAFSRANLAAYKITPPEGTGFYLRVDDTGTTTARIVGYESMTDASTGQGAFPLQSQAAGGLWWGKSDQANATARPWRLYASARALHLWVSPSSTMTDQVTGMLYTFGDTLSYRSGDAFGCLITGGTTAAEVGDSIVTLTGCLGYGNGSGMPADAFLARSPLGVGGALNVRKISAANSGAAYSGMPAYSANTFPYPNPPNNALHLAPLELHHPQYGLLGRVAGVHHCAQTLGEAFSTDAQIVGEGAYAGKTLVALRVGPLVGGTVFIDTTGPWET